MKKSAKKFEKGVDKREWKWYNIQAVAQSEARKRAARSLKIEQQTKKYKLDSIERESCWIRFVRGSRSKILRKHELKGKSKQWKLQGKNELVFVLVLRAKALNYDLSGSRELFNIQWFREFDPGSGWTLAARLTHASRTVTRTSVLWSVADGWVTRE